MQAEAPLHKSKRLPWVDAARGFALFGILMVNVPAFNAPYFLYGGEQLFWDQPLDHTIQDIIDIFFQASFYTLFSLLFGFGMQMMKERAGQGILIRRLLILLGFGLIHAFFIWHGDILISYAVVGVLLFFFFSTKPKTLLKWFFILSIVPTLLYTWLLYMSRDYLGWVNRPAISDALANYSSESWILILKQNYQDWMYVNEGIGFIFLIISLLPMFLIGMFFMKKRWLHEVEDHQPILKKILGISLFVFILFKAGPYMWGRPDWFNFAQDQIGGAASSIFYVVGITLLFQHSWWRKSLNLLTYVGRMSITNYISQSIICFILFYGPGFNLYGKVSPAWSVVIVIGIFICQIFASKWWLTHFQYGPLEWVWRSLTYNQRQPLKKLKKHTC
ncbi:DUF418 domain-containing protein [Salinibacillus xinjiangensis]|uniref:DUF418 domain-containing protein n=1 Tax=Salinibacillus xinjiangensis TaxID=1229268 RepID=A0A6G1X838_9BACI|nr:DUF418 domain-containing protein [Salinibacillus xinjiangensis]MRG87040.1 DUF418 domain-containing protein [Salinibacillus xinjiangensis]